MAEGCCEGLNEITKVECIEWYWTHDPSVPLIVCLFVLVLSALRL